jgi:RNA polymerase sigma-70 factor (ECF subfamily)
VYLRLLRLERTDLIRKPAAYVYLVAAQVAAEHRLREKSQPLALDSELLERLTDMSAVTAEEPGELVDVDRELQRLLCRLQVTHRNVLILRKRDGLSTREIASTLNLSEHTVKKYLFQAMAQLSVLRKNRNLEGTSDE